jgi:hypothetical protein
MGSIIENYNFRNFRSRSTENIGKASSEERKNIYINSGTYRGGGRQGGLAPPPLEKNSPEGGHNETFSRSEKTFFTSVKISFYVLSPLHQKSQPPLPKIPAYVPALIGLSMNEIMLFFDNVFMAAQEPRTNNHGARSYKIVCMILYDHRRSDEKSYKKSYERSSSPTILHQVLLQDFMRLYEA